MNEEILPGDLPQSPKINPKILIAAALAIVGIIFLMGSKKQEKQIIINVGEKRGKKIKRAIDQGKRDDKSTDDESRDDKSTDDESRDDEPTDIT